MQITTANYIVDQIIYDGSSAELAGFIGSNGAVMPKGHNDNSSKYNTPNWQNSECTFSATLNYGQNINIAYNLANTDSNQINLPAGAVFQLLGYKSENITKYEAAEVLDQVVISRTPSGNITKLDFNYFKEDIYSQYFIRYYNRDKAYHIVNNADETNNDTFVQTNSFINLVPSNAKDGIAKVGFQGYPGTEVFINGNKFIVGNSGQFELYNKNISIYALGAKAKVGEPFVITYKYIPSDIKEG